MQPIQISDHPEIPTIKRKCTYEEFKIETSRKTITLTLRVSHYKEVGNELIKLATYNDIFPRLVVDTTTMVNGQGEITENGTITEWDFFYNLGELPIIINNFFRSKILWADSLGRLNVY